MTKPQQPELRRSGRGATDQDSAKARAGADRNDGGSGRLGPVPPGNRPGWEDRSAPSAKRTDD
jgi:hypothetical protein